MKIQEFDPVIYPYKLGWIAGCCNKVKKNKI